MKKRGFTYIEVMIGMAIFAITLIFVSRLYRTTSMTMYIQQQKLKMMYTAQKVLENYKTTLNNNGSANDKGNGNGNGYAYGKNKPKFIANGSQRLSIPPEGAQLYIDDNKDSTTNYKGITEIGTKFLYKAIDDYWSNTVNSVTNTMQNLENSTTYFSDLDINSINNKIDSGISNIRTDTLDLNQNVKFGSPTEPVVIVLNGANVNSGCGKIEVYGDLIILNSINCNNSIEIDTYKVNNQYGALYVSGNANFNQSTKLNIGDTLYGSSFNFRATAQILANNLITNSSFGSSLPLQMTVNNDIIVGALTCNSSAQIYATYGDFVADSNISSDGPLSMTVGGRACIGGNLTLNSTISLSSGGQTTALLLREESVNNGSSDSGGTQYMTVDGFNVTLKDTPISDTINGIQVTFEEVQVKIKINQSDPDANAVILSSQISNDYN